MKYLYKTINVETMRGIKLAERYQRSGWFIASVGLFTIQFYKPVPRSGKPEEPVDLVIDHHDHIVRALE